jgi:hypothetical protein
MIDMEKMVGYCGIICSDCPVFVAALNYDNSERRRVAEIFTKQYGAEYKPTSINCDGCLSVGPRVSNYCNMREIRKSAKETHVENCAHSEAINVKNSLEYSLDIRKPKKP